MIEDKELGLKIAESSDEAFWTNKKEEVEQALKNNARDFKTLSKILELCEEQLKLSV
jgi:hypothetical protein